MFESTYGFCHKKLSLEQNEVCVDQPKKASCFRNIGW